MEVRLLQSHAQLAHADNIPLFQHFGQLQRPQWNWGNSFSTKDSAHKRHVLCLSKTGVFWIYIFIKYKHIHMHIYFGEVSEPESPVHLFHFCHFPVKWQLVFVVSRKTNILVWIKDNSDARARLTEGWWGGGVGGGWVEVSLFRNLDKIKLFSTFLV